MNLVFSTFSLEIMSLFLSEVLKARINIYYYDKKYTIIDLDKTIKDNKKLNREYKIKSKKGEFKLYGKGI